MKSGVILEAALLGGVKGWWLYTEIVFRGTGRNGQLYSNYN